MDLAKKASFLAQFWEADPKAGLAGSSDATQVGHNDPAVVACDQISNLIEFMLDLAPRHLAVFFHPLCLEALLPWLPAQNLKLRREYGAAVDLFTHWPVPPVASAQKRRRKI